MLGRQFHLRLTRRVLRQSQVRSIDAHVPCRMTGPPRLRRTLASLYHRFVLRLALFPDPVNAPVVSFRRVDCSCSREYVGASLPDVLVVEL